MEQSIAKWGKRCLVCATLISLCVLCVILNYVLGFLSTPVSIIIWTTVIVFLLRNIVNGLEKKGMNRVLGSVVAYIVMLIVVVLIGLFMFSPAFGIGEQIKNMIENIPAYANAVSDWMREMHNQYGYILQSEAAQKAINDAMSTVSSIGSNIATASASGLFAVGGMLGTSFMAIGIALIIAFWILIELPKLGREVNRFIPSKYKEDSEMLHYTFTHIMAGYIKGTFLQCFIIGLASGILFMCLGISNSGALGCITGVLNIIPIIGPWIGGAVAALGGLFTSIWAAIFALAGTIVIQQIVYNFVSPKIMQNAVDIHPALTLFALTVGAAIGGVMSGIIGALVGMLLSIPAVAVFKALFVYYYEKRTGRRIVSPDGVFFKGKPQEKDNANPRYDATSGKLKKKSKK
ncbi:MAG: AI-2E family transporter [Coriobacteriia bacterium]|nr:AI-2E family transporter [Coriobacteriia bacterium]